MTHFLSASLFFLAGRAVFGTVRPSVLAAKARKPSVAAMTLIIAAFVVHVLVAAAATLHHS